MTLPDIRSDIPEEEMCVPDTCLDALKEVPNFLDQFRQLTGNPSFEFGEFKPCFIYHERMDWLEYLEEDCCTVTEYQRGSNIALLRKWDGKKYCGIVGIKIVGFSAVASPEVVEAFRSENAKRVEKFLKKEDGMCAECGQYKADPPSDVCPGCEAYRDHTR